MEIVEASDSESDKKTVRGLAATWFDAIKKDLVAIEGNILDIQSNEHLLHICLLLLLLLLHD